MYKGGRLSEAAREIDAAAHGLVGGLVKRGDVTGRAGQALLVPSPAGISAHRLLVVGLGEAGKLDLKVWRFLGARWEVRDFYSGNPSFNAPTRSGGQHNIVVGGGFSGAMTAVNLARLSWRPLHVAIINAHRPTGRGCRARGIRRLVRPQARRI